MGEIMIKTEKTNKKITKELRVLDEMDLQDINHTFREIKLTLDSINYRMDSVRWVVGAGLTIIAILIGILKFL